MDGWVNDGDGDAQVMTSLKTHSRMDLMTIIHDTGFVRSEKASTTDSASTRFLLTASMTLSCSARALVRFSCLLCWPLRATLLWALGGRAQGL